MTPLVSLVRCYEYCLSGVFSNVANDCFVAAVIKRILVSWGIQSTVMMVEGNNYSKTILLRADLADESLTIEIGPQSIKWFEQPLYQVEAL